VTVADRMRGGRSQPPGRRGNGHGITMDRNPRSTHRSDSVVVIAPPPVEAQRTLLA
jgi:hypothetical protein